MSHDDDVERVLEEGRIETTPQLDARVLERAARRLPGRRRWKVWAAAAMVLVTGSLLAVGFTNGGGGGSGAPIAKESGGTKAPAQDSFSGDRIGYVRFEAGHEYVGLAGGGGGGVARTDGKDADIPPEARSLWALAGDAPKTVDRYLRIRATPGVVTMPESGAEEYDRLEEGGFLDPRRTPLSTFSIDVDTASMSNVRRILSEGRLPPAGAVRIEEMVNYFTYDYPEPDAGMPFSVTTEVADCPWNPAHRLVHVGIQGRRIGEGELPARNLVFLLDVSGSMNRPSKLPLVKGAMKLLAGQLNEDDRVAIVVYAGASGVVLEPTDGSNRAAILDALDRLKAGGSTNGGDGIRLAYALARQSFDGGALNRVILATDGDFNVGTTSRDDLLSLIEKEREGGIQLTVLGVGGGNLKDSQMEMLADKGNGNYAYLDTMAEARKVLVSEAGGTLVTIAADVKIQVEFNPERVGSYRLVGYENRRLADRDFNDDTKDAGEIGAGHSVTALYEISPPAERAPAETDPLKYQDPGAPSGAAFSDEILMLKLRYKAPGESESRLVAFPVRDPGNVAVAGTSPDFRFSAAVAAFGQLLRGSEHRGDATFEGVKGLAHGALGEDPHAYRREFLRLVGVAELLTPTGDDGR